MSSSNTSLKKVLLLGCRGGLAQIFCKIVSQELPQYEILGIDSRSIRHLRPPKRVTFRQMTYRRGAFENLFREQKFDVVLNLARIGNTIKDQESFAKRFDLNVLSIEKILELCLSAGVKRVILLSTFHVYGAIPDNPAFLTEDAPLRASLKYPEIRDVVDMDQIATKWMWRHQTRMSTVIFRPCNIIGPQTKNTITKYLCGPVLLKILDFRPIFQFIHELDMARLLVLALGQKIPGGVYNAAPLQTMPLNDAYHFLSGRQIPFTMGIASLLNLFLKFSTIKIPEYLLDYLRFSCLIDPQQLNTYLPENFWRFSAKKALESLRESQKTIAKSGRD